jgi:hypothetical protein
MTSSITRFYTESSVVLPNVTFFDTLCGTMLSFIMLSVIVLSVIMLSVIMLSVVVPLYQWVNPCPWYKALNFKLYYQCCFLLWQTISLSAQCYKMLLSSKLESLSTTCIFEQVLSFWVTKRITPEFVQARALYVLSNLT